MAPTEQAITARWIEIGVRFGFAILAATFALYVFGILEPLVSPQELVNLSHVDYMRDAGAEGIELIMWLIMRGALNENVEEVYRHYHVPASNTAAGLIILENR